jgi:hypothetical protein
MTPASSMPLRSTPCEKVTRFLMFSGYEDVLPATRQESRTNHAAEGFAARGPYRVAHLVVFARRGLLARLRWRSPGVLGSNSFRLMRHAVAFPRGCARGFCSPGGSG